MSRRLQSRNRFPHSPFLWISGIFILISIFFALMNGAGGIQATISKDYSVEMGERVLLKDGDKEISMTPININNQIIKSIPQRIGEKEILYKKVAGLYDVSYKILENGVKEEIIIRTPEELKKLIQNGLVFRYRISIRNLEVVQNADKSLANSFIDPKTKTIYEIPILNMIDGNKAESFAVSTTMTKEKDGSYVFSVQPDPTWLMDPSRKFPLIIDPSIVRGNPPILSMGFDEGNGQITQDSSTYNNDGTLGATSGSDTTDPSWKTEDQCISGKCLYYDGTDDYVTGGSDTEIDDINNITISAWIRPNSYGEGNYGRIVDKGVSSGATYGRGLFLCNDGGVNCNVGSLSFYQNFDGVDGWWSTPANSIPLNTWSYITLVYDRTSASNNPTIYINGTAQTITENLTPSGSARSDANYNLYIGNRLGDDRSFKGAIDEVRIYNYERTELQIKQDFVSRGSVMGVSTRFGPDSNKVLSDGLVGYWKMDEAATPALDSSGAGNNGVWAGNTTATTGKFGSGLSFDGTGDWVDLATSINLGNTHTVSYWINYEDTGEAVIIGNVASVYASYIDSPGINDSIYYNNNNGVNYASVVHGGFTSGVWYHIAVVRNGTSVTFYKNGQMIGSPQVLGGNNDLTVDCFGAHCNAGGSFPFQGQLDEMRLYSRALSAGEIKSLYSWVPGPVAWFKLDENAGTTNIYDSSGNGTTGTLYGGMTLNDWVPGKYGKALKFDGNDDFVDVSGAAPFINELSGTMQVWVKPRITQSHTILTSGASSGGSDGIYFDTNVNTFRVSYRNAGWAGEGLLQQMGSFIPGQWYHLSATWTANSLKLYVNGILQESEALTSAIADQDFLVIGAYASEYSSPEDIFDGAIDEVKVYSYPRTPEQIIEDMNGGHPVGGSPVGSQAGYWKFDEGYGDIAYDWSPQKINGALAGGTTCPGDTTCPTWSNAGKSGKALNFNGNDYVNIGDVLDLSGNAPMALSAWVNITGYPGANDAKIVSKYNDGVTGEWYLSVDTAGKVGFLRECGSYGILGNKSVGTGAWHHIAGVYDGTNLKIYIDGILDKTGVDSCATTNTTADIYIGADDSNSVSQRNFNGMIDEVKIYATGLTEDQIKTEYNQGKSQVMGSKSTASDGKTADFSSSREYCVPGDTSTCNAPVGHWKLDEGNGQYAYDISGNGNVGALGDTPTVEANDPQWISGKSGKALSFNPANSSYVSIPENGALYIPGSFTTSMWVRRTGSPSDMYGAYLFSDYDSLCTHSSFAVRINNGIGGAANTVGFFWENGGIDPQATSTTVLGLNTWYYITAVWDGTNRKIYVNGVLEDTDSTAQARANVGQDTSIGRPGSCAGLYAPADIDDVRLYDYARTPAQIAWEYNRGAPIAWWKLDECSGAPIQDWAPNATGGFKNTDGTITIGGGGDNSSLGSCTTSGAWFDGGVGKFGASIDLDGNDDYVSMGDTATIEGLTEATVCAWIKYTPASVTTDGAIVSRYAGANEGWLMWVDDDASVNGRIDTVSFAVDPGANGPGRVEGSNGLVTTGQWDQYCGVFKGGSYIRLYKNGKLDRENTTSIVATVNSVSANLYIGRIEHATPRWLSAQVDDVRIFNYALTQAQINDVFNNGAVSFR